jgi:hypothetical protein
MMELRRHVYVNGLYFFTGSYGDISVILKEESYEQKNL